MAKNSKAPNACGSLRSAHYTARMLCLHLPCTGFHAQPWRNGGGSTREIFRSGDGDQHAELRLSLARIESDGPFSEFPGLQRQQLLVSGAGLSLEFTAGHSLRLDRPHARARYAGTPPPTARLLDGPVDVLNLIHDPTAIEAELFHRPLLGSMLFFGRPGQHWLLVLLAGQACVKGPAGPVDLEQGDACLLRGDGGRVCVEGGGELALARICRSRAESV